MTPKFSVSRGGVYKVLERRTDSFGYEYNAVIADAENQFEARKIVAALNAQTYRVVTEAICLCNAGVQECPAHPGRLLTQEEKIAFRKEWDSRTQRAVQGGGA